jgi:hypothetical protein
MARMPYALTGSIAENMFWTGNNWLSGNSSIEGNYTVTMKSGSVTTFLSGTQLTVRSGATLVVEPNAQLVMNSGSGIIVENGATVRVLSNATLTIPSGGTLQANAGAQFKFNPGSGVVSYGQLNAYGADGLPVSFVSVYGSGGTWSGIVLNGSGANGSTLQYARVENVLTYGGAAVIVVGAAGVSVLHCTISGNVNYSTSGLAFASAGSPEVAYNSINGNGRYGVSYWNSNGNIYKNTLQDNATGGVQCSYYSSPMFGHYGAPVPYPCNNIISGGNYGVYAESYSYPYVGSYYNSYYYGNNSITGSATARVYAGYYCDVLAEMNYWGSNPNKSWFQTSQGSISWQPYLASDPCTGGGETEGLVSSQDQIALAMNERAAGNLTQATNRLENVSNANPSSRLGQRALLALLYIYRDNGDTGIAGFVRQQWQQHRSSDAPVTLAVAKMLAQQSRVTESADLYNAVVRGNPNSQHEKAALLDLFYLYAVRPDVQAQAEPVLATLQASYPNDADVLQVAWLFTHRGTPGSLHRDGASNAPTQLPDGYALSQNYPNPFNPTTIIQYSIPKDARVSLVVYDVLGREVAVLESGVKSAGSFAVNFDASHLASGVYMYRLQADEFSMTRKMLVVK